MASSNGSDVTAVLDRYRPARFTDAEWELAGPSVRTAVAAAGPATPAAARIYLSALTAYLARAGVWDRRVAPDLTVLLAADRIETATSDPGFGSAQTRRQRGEALRTLARAVGAPTPPAPVRAVVDLTATGPARAFTRHQVATHRDSATVITKTLAGYTPRALPEDAWKLVAADARRLVAAADPTTRQAARVLASTLTAFLADTHVWNRTTRPDLAALLAQGVVTAHVTRTQFTTAYARANRHKFLTQLGRAAGAIAAATPRRARRIRVDPFLAAGVVRPIPVVTLAAARGLDQTDRPVNLDHIAGAITRVRDTDPNPNTQVTTETTLTALAALTHPTGPGPVVEQPVAATPPPAPARRTRSRRAALAAAAEAHARAQQAQADTIDAGASRLPDPATVPAALRSAVERFEPNHARRQAWATNRDLAIRLVYAYGPRSPRNAANIASYLSHYLTWAAGRDGRDPDQPLALADLLGAEDVEAFLDASTWQGPSQSSSRSVLRRIARNLRPQAAPLRLPHAKPGAPYSAKECAAFTRLAWHQPTATRQRRLAFIIGLGLGAGLDALDLRQLAADHFETVHVAGRDLLVVHVPGQGPRARTVVVRDEYVPLVRRALGAHTAAGLGGADLVVANCPTAVNVATATLDRVAAADGARYRILTARLRHTWLVAAMCAPVPMAELMPAAGIRSARTLSELLEHCPAPNPAQVHATHAALAALTGPTTGGDVAAGEQS